MHLKELAMGLTKCRIGSFIEAYSSRCGIPDLIPDQVSGINIDKEFFEPAKQVGEDTSNYKVVPPDYFACNLMHVGRDNALPIALNHSGHNKYVSPAYSVFKIKDETIILKEYFSVLLKSIEKDRYFSFHTDSSIRQGLPWEDFCEIEVTLPDIDIQKRFVNVYLSLQKNFEVYLSKANELKTVCDGYLDMLKNDYPVQKIQDYIEVSDEKNSEGLFDLDNLRGISIQKTFIESKADMAGVSLAPYLIVRPNSFAFVTVTSRNGGKITLAYNDSSESFIVSSSYVVFRVKDKAVLLPEYLFMFFNRPEFDRYARFNSWGSAREVFSMDDMNDVSIPIPDVAIQRQIVNIHRCYIERQRIANCLKEQIKAICPILIKGSLETAN